MATRSSSERYLCEAFSRRNPPGASEHLAVIPNAPVPVQTMILKGQIIGLPLKLGRFATTPIDPKHNAFMACSFFELANC